MERNGEKSWILTFGDIAESCLMKEFCRDLYRSWAGKVWHLLLHEEREASDLASVFCAAFLVETQVLKIHLERKEYARVLQYPTVNTWWMMTNADADADSCGSWWHRGLTSWNQCYHEGLVVVSNKDDDSLTVCLLLSWLIVMFCWLLHMCYNMVALENHNV